jgi:hypothetical protein
MRCVFEPFNPTNREPQLAKCREMVKQQGLAATVRWLWTMCNGFKHVWKPGDWPFEGNPDMNRQLLVETGAKIVLLHRRNELQRAMSVQISEQMNLWTLNTAEDFQRVREHQFRALDISRLRREMEWARENLEWAKAQLKGADGGWREAFYEDFFASRLTTEARLEAVQGLLEFLGAGRASVPETVAMRTYLNPSVTGFQNADAYSKIPNIQEVERELGCRETGYVFDGAGAVAT